MADLEKLEAKFNKGFEEITKTELFNLVNLLQSLVAKQTLNMADLRLVQEETHNACFNATRERDSLKKENECLFTSKKNLTAAYNALIEMNEVYRLGLETASAVAKGV